LLGVLGMDSLPGIPFMIFGDVVMRNYFVAYDKHNNRIGFM